MKNLIYILLIFFSITFIGCNKFLDVQPKASISGENIIIDETSANAALNGVYSALRTYYSVDFQSIAYLSGDNIQWTGSQSQVQEFINHQVNAENATITSTWKGIYVAINRANQVIKNVEELGNDVIAESVRNRIAGEAHFIRALAYFDLVRTWGGVPLITQPTLEATDNTGIPRSTSEETYAQVLADLELAEQLLPETTNRFQATRKTVWALKARYYLYNKNWQEAENYATRLINDHANYELLTPYHTFFADGVTGTRESVFELFYNANELTPHR